MNDIEFIESFKKQSFACLIAAMIEGKEAKIQNYLSYPFFWDDPKIEDAVRITNSWIDKNSKQ